MEENAIFSTPAVQSSQTLYDGFLRLQCDRLRLPNQLYYDYYVLKLRADAVVIVAYTAAGNLVLIEEYRHPTKQLVLSLPGGYIDEGESPEEAAQRELCEETGYSADKFTLLGGAYPYPGLSSQKIYFVTAVPAVWQKEAQRDATELMRTLEKSPVALKRAIAAGTAVDGIMCTALYFYECMSGAVS